MLLDLWPLLQSAATVSKTGGATLGLDAGATVAVSSETSISPVGSDFRPQFLHRITKAGGASVGLHGGGTKQVTLDLSAVRRAQIREADELLLVGVL